MEILPVPGGKTGKTGQICFRKCLQTVHYKLFAIWPEACYHGDILKERSRCSNTPNQIMFCIKCGKQFEGNGYLCPECQAAQAPVQAPVEEPAVQTVPVEEAAAQAAPVQPVIPEAESVAGYSADEFVNFANANSEMPQEAPRPIPAEVFAAPVERPVPEFTPGFTLSAPEEKPKKKKKTGLWIGLGVLALALVAVIVLVALNWNKWFGKNDADGVDGKLQVPEDPGEYIAYLSEPRLQGFSDAIKEAYGTWKGTQDDGQSMETSIRLEVGEDILDLLSQALAQEGVNMDLGWLKEVNLDLYSNTAPGNTAEEYALAIALGETHLLSVNGAWSVEDMILYLSIPEINDNPLSVNLSEMLSQEQEDLPLEEALKLQLQLKKDMPGEDAVGEMAEGVIDILMKYLTADVTKTNDLLAVGEAEQEVTVLQVKISEANLAKMMQELLEYAKGNETLRQMVTAYAEYMAEYYDLLNVDFITDYVTLEAYEAFLDESIEAMQEVIDEAEDGNQLLLDVYADGDQILGLRLSAEYAEEPEEDEEQIDEAAYALTLTKDGTQYTEIRIVENVTITGEATNKDGKLSGSYLLVVEGETYLEMELKDVDTATGFGTYILSPEPQLLEMLELDGLTSTLASTISLELKLEENLVAYAIKAGKATVLSLEVQGTVAEGKEVVLPKDAVEVDGMMSLVNWAKDVHLDKVVQSLKDAGVPKEYHKLLDTLAGELTKAIQAGDEAMALVGTWEGEVDVTESFTTGFAASDGQDMLPYLDMKDLTLKLSLTFREDGTFTLAVDEGSASAMIDKALSQVAAGMREYLQDELKKSGVDISVDELLAAQGTTLEELMDMSIPEAQRKMMVAQMSVGSEGEFTVEDGELYLNDDSTSYVLENDKLTITLPDMGEAVFTKVD